MSNDKPKTISEKRPAITKPGEYVGGKRSSSIIDGPVSRTSSHFHRAKLEGSASMIKKVEEQKDGN